MHSLQEIESAICKLSSEDQAALVHSLPRLLPEWEAELPWRKILEDPIPSPALSRLVDRIDAEFRNNAKVFSEITDADFERHR